MCTAGVYSSVVYGRLCILFSLIYCTACSETGRANSDIGVKVGGRGRTSSQHYLSWASYRSSRCSRPLTVDAQRVISKRWRRCADEGWWWRCNHHRRRRRRERSRGAAQWARRRRFQDRRWRIRHYRGRRGSLINRR